MQAIRNFIPNAITSGNLLCGCLAIVCCFNGQLYCASYLIGLAAVLDFFDGFTARALKSTSNIGKELDSLADVVTFGVVPGFIVYHLLPSESSLRYLAFLIPVFSAVRLAKFNVDTRQSDSFIGVPTPANAMLIASFPLMIHYNESFAGYITPTFLVALTLVMCYLLVAELPLFSLKFKQFGWSGNEFRYVFLIICLLLFAVFHFTGMAFVLILYIVLSMFNNATKKSST